MTTASIPNTPTGRSEFPDQVLSIPSNHPEVNNENTAWNTGISNKQTAPTETEKGQAGDPTDTRISLTGTGISSPMTMEEVKAELNAARGAAGKMNPQQQVNPQEQASAQYQVNSQYQANPQDGIPATTHTPSGTETGALSHCCESVYRNSCIAGSVILFALSIASFVVPSVSNYAEERGTVQALGYTAGAISLLASLGIACCVWSVYAKPDNDFRR